MHTRILWTLALLLAVQTWAVAADSGASPGPPSTTISTRVFGSAPPMTLLVAVLASDKLIAINTPLKNSWNSADPRFLSPKLRLLPNLGGWHGNRQANLEEILQARPDLIVAWDTPLLHDHMERDLQKINLPVLRLNIDKTTAYPQVFRTLGTALGVPERGEVLARYAEEELGQLAQFVATIPEQERVRVYYAENKEGLQTDCDRSFHAEPLTLAGGRNIWQCTQDSVMGLISVNFEQLLAARPEVIIAQDPALLTTIQTDARWRNLEAVQAHKIVVVPRTPFNWLDRPPSFMRILGAHWLAAQLYPKRYPYDLRAKVRRFMQFFFAVVLSDQEIDQILATPAR